MRLGENETTFWDLPTFFSLWGWLCIDGQERLSNNIGIGCKFKFKCKSSCNQQILRGYSDTMGKNRQRLIVLHMHNRGVVPGDAGGAMVPPDFGRSVNPISILGGRICPPNNTGTPRFSDLPTALHNAVLTYLCRFQGHVLFHSKYLAENNLDYHWNLKGFFCQIRASWF